MSLNVIAIVLSAVTLGLVTYLLLKLRDQNTLEKGNTDHLQTKLDSVSKDINDIENQLASVTTPINELNRLLGGNVTTGRLGELNLESIVKKILPDGSYNFQAQINPETQDRVDCAVNTMDSRFHSPNLPVVTFPPRKRLSSLMGVVTDANWFSISLISFETESNLVCK